MRKQREGIDGSEIKFILSSLRFLRIAPEIRIRLKVVYLEHDQRGVEKNRLGR